MNQQCVGACVEVDAGGKTQTREVRSGTNYKSQDEFTLHYGLADAEKITEVRMYITGSQMRVLTNVPVNQEWTLYTPNRLGDVDMDGEISVDEIRAAMLVMTERGVTLKPGSEIFDMDGDFDVDTDDIQLMGLGVLDPSVQ